MQIRQDHRIAQAQNAADFDDTMIVYARVINANREVWIKGLEGAELSLVDAVTFEAVAFAVWQKFKVSMCVTTYQAGEAPKVLTDN